MIAKAVREQIREVHDFFADVIRQGQAAGVVQRRPRPGRRGLDLRRRRPARDDRPPARRPPRRRPRPRPRLAPRLDARRRLTLSPPGGCSRTRPRLPLSSSLRCRSSRNRSRMSFSSIPPFIEVCRCRSVNGILMNVNEGSLRFPADLLRERRAADAARRRGGPRSHVQGARRPDAGRDRQPADHVESVCVCDLTAAFELSQPTISHHLKILRDAGLVEVDRRGTWAYYAWCPTRSTACATSSGPVERRSRGALRLRAQRGAKPDGGGPPDAQVGRPHRRALGGE